MSPILFFIIFFTCIGVWKIFLQINPAAVAFIDILMAAWEGLIMHKIVINIHGFDIFKWFKNGNQVLK